ncbi:MAG: glycosyltransferase family 4 protein, partial [Aeromonas sp.]
LQIPVALMYHGDVTGPEIYKRLLGNLYYRSVGHTSLQVPQVIFVNSLSYVQASPYLRQLKTQFVEAPPGVDAAMLRGQRDSSIVRQRQPRRYFLFVGKPQVKSKGLEVLVAAWQRLRHRYPEVDLVVIGGTARPSQNGLHFIGKISTREELAHWYASAEATLLPSTSTAESFGMVLAEALLAGCPIIGSDVGGIPTLISHGRNGYLVPPHDVAALAGAMERSLEQQGALRQVVAQQRQDHATRFSWERTSQIVARYLSQLAAKPGVVRQN